MENKIFDNVVANVARVQDFAPPLVRIQGCKNKSFTTKTTKTIFEIDNNHTTPWKHMET
jgi:hypothetical protein